MMMIPVIIIAEGPPAKGSAQKPDLGSATGHAKVWNHLSLLSPEKNAAFKQPVKGLCLGFTHLYFTISDHWLSVTFHHLLIVFFSFITLHHVHYILMSYNIFLR